MKILAVVCFTALLWGTIPGGASDAYLHCERYEIVTIQVGDDIWSIAKHYVGDAEDIRALIAAIHEINGIAPREPVYPGQKIRIPLRRAAL